MDFAFSLIAIVSRIFSLSSEAECGKELKMNISHLAKFIEKKLVEKTLNVKILFDKRS